MIKVDEGDMEIEGNIYMLMTEFGAIVSSFVLEEDERLNNAGRMLFKEDWYELKKIAKNLKRGGNYD